jgi:putative ABC transport system ATP-binding protein
MIELIKIDKKYKTDSVETLALSEMNLMVKREEFVAIMGPSGCGKSTLLNILGLLDQPDEGSFLFDGQEVSTSNETIRARLRKRSIGFIFQSFNLIDELTVAENIELPLIYNGVNVTERKKKVHAVLERMQIIQRAKHFPNQLSGGQQQRVAIARAVITDPLVILADEPTGNLDSVHGNEVMELLIDMNKKGTTIVMVTHSASDANFSHRIVHMLDGRPVTENMIRPRD